MQFRFPRLTPTVKKLLIFLGAVFVTVAVVQNLASVPVFDWLALDLDYSDGFLLNLAWQPLTYWMVEPPIPSALLDFALSLLFIYFFVSPFEEAFGTKRTIQLSVVGILSGAAAVVALAFVMPRGVPMYGPSCIAWAAFGAFPLIAPGREIMLFPLMIPLKPWTAVLLGLGIGALFAVLARDPFILAIDAGALLGGVAFTKWMTRPRGKKGKKPPRRRASGPDLRVLKGGADDEGPRWLN